jgi:hypothetical protein
MSYGKKCYFRVFYIHFNRSWKIFLNFEFLLCLKEVFVWLTNIFLSAVIDTLKKFQSCQQQRLKFFSSVADSV